MFLIGEKVVYKANSICCVEAIESPSFVSDKQKKYYKLRVLYSIGNEVVYVPVENVSALRKVVTKQEAEKCFEFLKNIQICEAKVKQPAVIAEHFQTILKNGDMKSSLTVLKELLVRKNRLEKEGKNIKQIEQQYLTLVHKAVVNELSCVLEIKSEDVENRIMQTLCIE